MTINLIASSFNNDIHWFESMSCIDNIYLYEKSDNNIPPSNLDLIFKKIINIGCEHQSYIQHIVDNYDNLADINIFTQADPFPHIAISKESFVNIVKNKKYYKFDSGYIDITGGFTTSDLRGRSSVKEQFNLDCKSFGDKIGISLPTPFLYQTNGIFGATKNCIHHIPKNVWQYINSLITDNSTHILPDNSKRYLFVCDNVYIMERMWFNLLNQNNTLPKIYKANNHIPPYGFNRII